MLRSVVESLGFSAPITAVIIINAVTLGLKTWPKAMAVAGAALLAIDTLALWVFTVEIGASMYTVFQVMILESWSMGIVRPVMDVYPDAWLFFLPFIFVTTFTVLNLFIALIVNSMQSLQSETNERLSKEAVVAHDERDLLLRRIEALSDEVRLMRSTMSETGSPVELPRSIM